jgi:hypothetical protein
VPRTTFGPRRPVISVPPPDLLTQQQKPGTFYVARPPEAAEAALLYGGQFILGTHSTPAPPNSQQLPGPCAVFVQGPPPHPDSTAGQVIVGPHGIVQPVVNPNPPGIQRPEDSLRPGSVDNPIDPGRISRSGGVPSSGNPPPAPRALVSRGDDAPPGAGGVVVGEVGFPFSRQPARTAATIVRGEDRPSDPDPRFAADVTAGPVAPQQKPGTARVFAAEEPAPFPGFASVWQRPLVPSNRLRTQAVLARIEEPPPAAGQLLALHPLRDNPPPARFTATIAAASESQPFAGWTFALRPPAQPLTPQQRPGTVVLAWTSERSPEPGWSFVWTGRAAGATPPVPPPQPPTGTSGTPGGRLQRADVARYLRRLPRMGAATLQYQTRVKTPTEALTLVFDFSNFPEVVGGALITQAVVSGPGGAPLAGLVAGPATVLAAPVTVDSLGNTVAVGKGVAVTFFGGSAGSDVIVECAATLSTGDMPKTIQGKIAVRNAI